LYLQLRHMYISFMYCFKIHRDKLTRFPYLIAKNTIKRVKHTALFPE
jgi:hypothetical protein